MSREGSRIPGFYRLSLSDRRAIVAERAGVELAALARAVEGGGLDVVVAEKLVENVLGTYAMPFGVALNVRVNGRDCLVPMVVEEPSVVAAASNAARMARAAGGFTAESVESFMIGQVELRRAPGPQALRALELGANELLEIGARAVPGLVARGGGPRKIEIRDLGQGAVVLHVLVDCLDAMGANLVNSIAEAIGPRAAQMAGAELGLRILSNLCDRRRVRASCRIHAAELASKRAAEVSPLSERTGVDGTPAEGLNGHEIVDAIVAASRFAELDPYRAATHNKGIMNGVDAVVIATGNDFRAVEAGAHAYAARSGRYVPLAVWRRDGEDLVGELEMPLALGIVGGTLRVHPAAQLALSVLGVTSAQELAYIAASVGLASNLAALRALATEGIQRGHMALHARSVALAAGAVGEEVERVAEVISARGLITQEAAEHALLKLRVEP